MAAAEKPKRTPTSLFALLRDVRVIQVIIQIVFIVLLVSAVSIIWINVFKTLEARRLSIYFDVMKPPTGFQLSESPSWYTSDSSFGTAFRVGIVHTLQVVLPGLAISTLIGVFTGIFLLSRNWLFRSISQVYVEVLRNTPLLVQLFFWYFIVFFALPLIRDAISFPSEGVAFIHFRVIGYAILLPLVWWLSKNAAFPPRITQGAFLGVIVLELALRIAGPARLDLVLAGATSFIMLMVLWFGTKQGRDFSKGFLSIVAGQTIVTGLFLHLAYFLDMSLLNLPTLSDGLLLEVHPIAYFSIKGMALPELVLTSRFGLWMAFVMAGTGIAVVLWMYAGHVIETTGRPIRRVWYAVMAIFGMALLGWIFITAQPVPEQLTIGEGEDAVTLPYDQALMHEDITPAEENLNAWYPVKLALPEKSRLNYTRGTVITPEYTALLVGLIIYTSAFIAEIVRAGIQAVPYGQLEAARALGLSYSQTLQLIILPQALRVIIPPLGNQYLNLAKNSSLAIAVAYSDVYQVGQTMMNTSGQSIVGFAMIFLVYITMSLIISFFMNLLNARFQLVTR